MLVCPICEKSEGSFRLVCPECLDQLQAENKRLKNENINIADDLNYWKAVTDGSWPSAIEVLEVTLEKVKALKGN